MKPKLREVFVQRLQDEMKERRLSINGLARLCKLADHPVGYASIHRILAGKQDPTLEKVSALSEAIGLPAWAMLTDEAIVEQRIISPPKNVVSLPAPYRKIFGEKPESTLPKPKSAARKKRS